MQAAEIRLCPAERAVLEGWARAPRTEQRRALRARLVLFAAAGMATGVIAERLGIRSSTVSKWRGRFARLGLDGLEDAARHGRPARYDAAAEARILAQLDEPPPAGYARWNGRLLAAALGDVSPRPGVAGAAGAPHQPRPAAQLVRQHRSRVRRQGRRHRRPVPQPARACGRPVRRREAAHPGARARPGVAAPAERPGADRLRARLQAPWHHHPVRRPRGARPAWSRPATTSAAGAPSSSTS